MRSQMDECEFCFNLQGRKNVDSFVNKERKATGQDTIYHDYSIALVVRSYLKGKKRSSGRTTYYRYRGLGYCLRFCPECGRRLT